MRGVAPLLAGLVLGVVLTAASGGLVSPAAAAARDASPKTESWPSYLQNGQRTGASGDTTLSTANVSQLTRLWSYQTGGVIAAQPAVVNRVVYVGSWDGYEYALSAATGAVVWKTYLGITTASTCNPPQAGISSSATVDHGVVYVGGGDAYWYALDAETGEVLWKVFTGDNSATGGHYNWSSPLIYHGYAYIGIASFGDCPLVQGQLLQVDLRTHQIVHTLSFVPNGQVGGGVWTSPSVDPATNTIYVTTGTLSDPSQTLSQAIVAIDASTLDITSSWQIPQQQAVVDSDWGTTPILFTDQDGLRLVAAINKNGYAYAFLRSDVGSGPVWQRQVALGGPCPCDASVSSMAFGNGLLYAAGGTTTIGGVRYSGSVRALDPATGNIVWVHPDPSAVVPALTYDNGLVIAGAGPTLEVLDASTGNRLYSFTTGSTLFGAASVANGTIYFGSTDENVYALALSTAECPDDWNCADIGSSVPAGSQSLKRDVWTIQGAGSDIWGTADQFHFVWQSLAADGGVNARLTSQTDTSTWAKAGVMLRLSADPGAPYYAVYITPANGLAVQFRSAQGASAQQVVLIPGATPAYLRVARAGSTFTASTSSDGVTWTPIAGSSLTLTNLSGALLAGLAVTSHNGGVLSTATFDSVSIG